MNDSPVETGAGAAWEGGLAWHETAQGAEGWLLVFWRHRWVVAGAVTITLSAAVTYLVRAVPIYVSNSQVYVERSGPRILRDQEEGVMTRSDNYLYTQAELLRATPILTAALERVRPERLRCLDGVTNPVGYLKRRLRTSVGRNDDLLKVSFGCPYPVESAQVVNAVVDA